jgi:hypothetical protein
VKEKATMKLRATFGFKTTLEATLPNGGLFGLIKPTEILGRAKALVHPIFEKALNGAVAQLAIIGVTVKVIKSESSFEEVPEIDNG